MALNGEQLWWDGRVVQRRRLHRELDYRLCAEARDGQR